MQVKVVDLLPAVVPAVDHDAVAVSGDPFVGGEVRGDPQHPAQHGFVFGRDVRERGNQAIRHDEDVGGCERLDVPEGGHEIILVDDVGGDLAAYDLREDGVFGHVWIGG